MPSLTTLVHKRTKKHLDEKALSSVEQEMAKPRLAASVREGIEKSPMTADAKFRMGELLHNHNTSEDGLVTRVYELEGAITYEVAVPVIRDTWAGSHYVSDWDESALELSSNASLTSSGKPPRDWPS
jgi:hypothetical protein